MPTPKKGPRLGGSPSHQKAILANLATSLFEHGRITTTEAKARFLRPYAERLITKAKRGDLHNRRQVLSVIRDKSVVHELFTSIGPRFADRPGGYTRITKIGPRKGDNAPMAVIELVEAEFTPKVRSTRPQQRPAQAPIATAGSGETVEPIGQTDNASQATADASQEDHGDVAETDVAPAPESLGAGESAVAPTDDASAPDSAGVDETDVASADPVAADEAASESATAEVESVDADADAAAAEEARTDETK